MNGKPQQHFYNKWCIYILERFEYSIPNDFPPRGIYKHLSLIAVSLLMFIISFVSVGTIRTYVFLFHLLCLFHKWIIIFFNKRNCEIIKNANKSGTKPVKVTSPYHKQFSFYTYSFIFLIFISILSVLKIQSIDSDVVYSIVVYLSILMTFIQELFDGLVVLYNASAKIRQIG